MKAVVPKAAWGACRFGAKEQSGGVIISFSRDREAAHDRSLRAGRRMAWLSSTIFC
jgi:hypothetical protein